MTAPHTLKMLCNHNKNIASNQINQVEMSCYINKRWIKQKVHTHLKMKNLICAKYKNKLILEMTAGLILTLLIIVVGYVLKVFGLD